MPTIDEEIVASRWLKGISPLNAVVDETHKKKIQ
jgi:hypothetical protein